MKFSLRFKMFAAVSSLIVFFILFSWTLNNLFLEKFYFYNKKNALNDSFKTINSIYKGNTDDIFLELERIESTKGLHILILDKNFEIKYSSNERIRDSRVRRQDRLNPNERLYLPDNLIKNIEARIKNGKTLIEIRRDDRLNSNFIGLYSMLNNGDIMFLNTPVAAIQESVKITNNFFAITGMITLILGIFVVFIMTGKFTKPILELKEISKRMSKLDFSKRYPVKTSDEIGQLGDSINSMSEQLQKSIVELKEANEKLMEDIEQKCRIDEMRKEFISSVSHELKTPVSLIQGYALGLKLNVNKDEKSKNFYCDVIIDEGVKITKLVKQLLELAQIESGVVNLERVDFNLNEFVEQAVKKNEIMLKNKGIELILEKESDILVNADFDKAEQILMNYLSNAINHVDDRKVITVTVSHQGTKARISVYNSGEHIPVDSLEKIWTSFYKVDKARTRSYGGTGLGLSIVRAIQEMHQNGYGIANVEQGVRFWFELDVVKIQNTNTQNFN